MDATLGLLLGSVAQTLNIYFVLLLIRVLLSWFPNVDWSRQPFALVSQLTDPYLNLFRQFIPPVGGIDFSAILAFFLLQAVTSAVGSVAASMQMSASSFY